MFRFSVDTDTPILHDAERLAEAEITPDQDFAQRLRDTGSHRDDETILRAENASPGSLAEAVNFVRGVLTQAPSRVWLGDEEHDIDADTLADLPAPPMP